MKPIKISHLICIMYNHHHLHLHHLLNIGKVERRLTGNGILSLQSLPLLTSTHNLTSLTTLINSNNLQLLGASNALNSRNHLAEDSEFIERQLTVEDSLGDFLVDNETLLESLDEGHGLLHLAELADLGVQLLVVEGDADSVESFTHKVDVLLLPDGELLGRIDAELLGLAGVEGSLLALGELLHEVGLRGGDAGGGRAGVVKGCGQLEGELGDLGEAGVVDGRGLDWVLVVVG